MAGEALERDDELLDPEMEVDDESASILDMSDEELDAYYAQKTGESTDDQQTVQKDDKASDEKASEQKVDGDDKSDGEAGSSTSDNNDDDQGKAASQEKNNDTSSNVDDASKAEGDSKNAGSDDDAAKGSNSQKSGDNSGEINYEEEYKKILAPFRANGRMISVDNVDDAITLMQMGANYNKKMAALKPSLRVVKLLEQNDLLDEGKLNHLIDISKNDPGAIAKLLKDADIDPEDIEKDSDYQPQKRQVNDAQIALDQVLDDLKDNESYSQTVKIVGNQWDDKSRKQVLENPEIIRVIDEHVQAGIYDIIQAELDKERALGRYAGMSDLEAYKSLGDKLNAAGRFSSPPDDGGNDDSSSEASNTDQQANSDTDDKDREDRKRAAASTGSKSSSDKKSSKNDLDPLSMSDEEFEKASAQGLFN